MGEIEVKETKSESKIYFLLCVMIEIKNLWESCKKIIIITNLFLTYNMNHGDQKKNIQDWSW